MLTREYQAVDIPETALTPPLTTKYTRLWLVTHCHGIAKPRLGLLSDTFDVIPVT